MSELLYGVALGVIVALLTGLFLVARVVLRRLDALRVELATARIEGLFSLPPKGNGGGGPTPIIGRRRRHLGVVSAIAGTAVATVAWMREHRATTMGLAAAAALIATSPLYLGGSPGAGPAAPLPTSTVTALLPTAPRLSTATVTAMPHSPSPSALPPAQDTSRRLPSTAAALPRPTGPGLMPRPQLPPTSPAPTASPTDSPRPPTADTPPPARPIPPGRDPHCLRLELLDLVDAGTCVSL